MKIAGCEIKDYPTSNLLTMYSVPNLRSRYPEIAQELCLRTSLSAEDFSGLHQLCHPQLIAEETLVRYIDPSGWFPSEEALEVSYHLFCPIHRLQSLKIDSSEKSKYSVKS